MVIHIFEDGKIQKYAKGKDKVADHRYDDKYCAGFAAQHPMIVSNRFYCKTHYEYVHSCRNRTNNHYNDGIDDVSD